LHKRSIFSGGMGTDECDALENRGGNVKNLISENIF
jgi:hypothetical protein